MTEVQKLYQERLAKNLHVDIPISQSDIEFLQNWVNKMVTAKMGETNHKTDHSSMGIREMTGKVGELAVERWLLCPFIDTTIGKSKDYNVPDMRAAGYEMGIKTVTLRNVAPLVPKHPKWPELICVWDSQKMVVHIMGIATPQIITEFGDDSLVLCKDVKLSYKTGFGRYDKLIPPSEICLQHYKTAMG